MEKHLHGCSVCAKGAPSFMVHYFYLKNDKLWLLRLAFLTDVFSEMINITSMNK